MRSKMLLHSRSQRKNIGCSRGGRKLLRVYCSTTPDIERNLIIVNIISCRVGIIDFLLFLFFFFLWQFFHKGIVFLYCIFRILRCIELIISLLLYLGLFYFIRWGCEFELKQWSGVEKKKFHKRLCSVNSQAPRDYMYRTNNHLLGRSELGKT